MSSAEKRSKRTSDTQQVTSPSEYQSTTLEWPLTGLKQLFDSSKGDHKSKVVKSPVFGGGRWTVLFYAQSGSDQYCSLYLNAEPLEHERLNPLLIASNAAAAAGGAAGSAAGATGSGRYHSNGRKAEGGGEEHLWQREGLFRFTFTISTIGNKDAEPLGRKEANDHVFSHKTSNWGWASFARRADVFYNQNAVKAADAFLITVQISTVYEKPRMYKPVGAQVPTPLITAWGSLLDDPEHSDVVFLFPSKRLANGRRSGPTRKLYAIKKILAARSTYFRDMFEGGFLEAEQAEVLSDVGSTGGGPEETGSVRTRTKGASAFSLTDEDEYRIFDTLMDNSDEELDDFFLDTPMATSPSTPPLSATGDYAGLGADISESTLSRSKDAYETEGADEDGEDLFHDNEDISNSGDAVQNTSSLGHGSFAVGQQGTGDDRSASLFVESSNETRAVGQFKTTSNLEGEVARAETGEAAGESMDRDSSSSSGSTLTPAELLAGTGPNRTSGGTDNGSLPLNVAARIAAGAGASSVQGKPVTPIAKARSRRQLNARATGSGSHSSASTRKRRQVIIQDSAYPTFKALLHFLYTDSVHFAPLTSSFLPSDLSMDELGGFPSTDRDSTNVDKFAHEMHRAHKKRKELIDSYCAQHPDKPQPCSAKAMYQLADKLHIEDLRKRAQDHIANSLTVHCIVFEAFGSFTMRFPEIRKMEIDYLLKHWNMVKKSTAMKTIFSRSAAHPGLAEVWPYLLSQLEYKREEASSSDDDAE